MQETLAKDSAGYPVPEAEKVLKGADKSEAPFPNCWADDDADRLVVTMGGVTFRLRCLTIGEVSDIARATNGGVYLQAPTGGQVQAFAAMRGVPVDALTAEDRQELDRLLVMGAPRKDFIEEFILTVAAALGAHKKYGNEGWSAPKPVTLESVRGLKDEVLTALYNAYSGHFPARSSRVAESAKVN